MNYYYRKIIVKKSAHLPTFKITLLTCVNDNNSSNKNNCYMHIDNSNLVLTLYSKQCLTYFYNDYRDIKVYRCILYLLVEYCIIQL